MDDFAQARFDRAIEESPDLQRLLQPLTGKAADRLRLKRVGDGHIFLRGADNAHQVASVDADLVLLDEYDQMPDGTLERAETRLASSAQGRLRIASTPRFPEAGINGLFLQSDQRHYYLPCPACGEEQPLRFPENVDLKTPAIVCRACRAPLDVTQPGRWVAEAPGNTRIRGYHLSRLYSPWLDLETLVAHSERVGPAGLQDFQNSDLGEVFSAPNSGLTLDMLDRNRDDYALDDYAGEPCMMGVDVGIKFHVVIRETAPNGTDPECRHHWRRRRCWFAGTVDTIAEVAALIDRFRVQRCIIDSLPETHIVGPFARRNPEVVRLARYGRQEPSHEFRKRDGGIPGDLPLQPHPGDRRNGTDLPGRGGPLAARRARAVRAGPRRDRRVLPRTPSGAAAAGPRCPGQLGGALGAGPSRRSLPACRALCLLRRALDRAARVHLRLRDHVGPPQRERRGQEASGRGDVPRRRPAQPRDDGVGRRHGALLLLALRRCHRPAAARDLEPPRGRRRPVRHEYSMVGHSFQLPSLSLNLPPRVRAALLRPRRCVAIRSSASLGFHASSRVRLKRSPIRRLKPNHRPREVTQVQSRIGIPTEQVWLEAVREGADHQEAAARATRSTSSSRPRYIDIASASLDCS